MGTVAGSGGTHPGTPATGEDRELEDSPEGRRLCLTTTTQNRSGWGVAHRYDASLACPGVMPWV